MERSIDGRHLYQRVAMQPVPSDSKNSIADDYEDYKQYYSTERLPFYYVYNLGRFRLVLAVFILCTLLLLFFSKTIPSTTVSNVPEVTDKAKQSPHIPMKSLGGTLLCDPSVMKPSATVPEDVNRVRPADIKVIGAMGDSIMVGSWSKNFLDDKGIFFPGNSFAIGGDETLQTHITLANILRKFNSNIVGASHGESIKDNGLNVGVSGRTSLDMPRQANELIERMKERGISLTDDWKLIILFIGTNDIGKLRCIQEETTTREVYKAKIEEAISLLRSNMNRTIVSLLSIWNSQLIYDAASLIKNGALTVQSMLKSAIDYSRTTNVIPNLNIFKVSRPLTVPKLVIFARVTRMECGDDYITKRDALTVEYRKVVYEIQNEKKFDHSDFTVVVQGFMDDIKDAFRNKQGQYDKSFYGADVFHLSKYGNAVLGKFLWNTLLEPVGRKTTKADLGDDSVPLKCPAKDSPFIQTLGNRS